MLGSPVLAAEPAETSIVEALEVQMSEAVSQPILMGPSEPWIEDAVKPAKLRVKEAVDQVR